VPLPGFHQQTFTRTWREKCGFQPIRAHKHLFLDSIFHVLTLSINTVILPPSALEQLSTKNLEYPMLFKLTNPRNGNTTHCGVLEFISEEGFCHIPYWMMQLLLLEEGEMLVVENVSLPQGTFVKFQPHESAFMETSNPKAMCVISPFPKTPRRNAPID